MTLYCLHSDISNIKKRDIQPSLIFMVKICFFNLVFLETAVTSRETLPDLNWNLYEIDI